MVIPKLNQNEAEFFKLLDIYIIECPRTILEVGTYEGGTLYQWIRAARDKAKIVSIDNQHTNRGNYDEWVNGRLIFEWINADSKSQEAVDLAKKYAPYDWIFIDGDHSYEGVKHDWLTYGPMASQTGVVVFHDILPHEPYEGQPVEVDKLWVEIKEIFPDTHEIVEPNLECGGEGPGIGIIYL